MKDEELIDAYKDDLILRIVSEKEVMYVEMEIEGEEKGIKTVADLGREVATEEDYFNIGLKHGLQEWLKKLEEKPDVGLEDDK